MPVQLAGLVLPLLGAGAGRTGIGFLSKFSKFKKAYGQFNQHPFGFGMMYAGGTTVGYHAMPANWKTGGKYVGRPQRLMRL